MNASVAVWITRSGWRSRATIYTSAMTVTTTRTPSTCTGPLTSPRVRL
jgi:hypothetical protein